MKARRLFITGTDTGVGKTFVACGLIAAARSMGLAVAAAKPLESGCARGSDGRLFPADAAALRDAAGRCDPLDLVCPYLLEKPLAPAYAAAAQGVTIDPHLITQSLDRLSEGCDLLIIEGAGGLLAPAWEGASMADLIALGRADTLVVARTGLGTINHTLLTVEALSARNIPVAGLVFNRAADPAKDPADSSEASNPSRISSLSGAPVWAVIPYSSGGPSASVLDALKKALAGWLGEIK